MVESKVPWQRWWGEMLRFAGSSRPFHLPWCPLHSNYERLWRVKVKVPAVPRGHSPASVSMHQPRRPYTAVQKCTVMDMNY